MYEKGIILTYGKKAISIQNENKEQFYAPYENIHEDVLNLINSYSRLEVKFKINYELYSGSIKNKKRFYAYDVKLSNIIII